MTESPRSEAVELIGRFLVEELTAPIDRSRPVVRLAGLDELGSAFDASVGFDLKEGEGAHSDEDLLAAVRTVIDHSVQTRHPRFVNQNWAGADDIGIVGDWLGALLNTTNATFEVAPVFTAIEDVVLRRLADFASYPTDTEIPPGIFAPGGSTSILYGLQLGRHAHDPATKQQGSDGRLAILASAASHYATVKSAVLLGLGTDAVYRVPVDPEGAMQPDEVVGVLTQARADGRTPYALVATAGTTTTSAFDPIDQLAPICRAEGLWLHVDGSYGGSALFSRTHRSRLAGIEHSDSFTWNLHKMAGITQQCSALLVRRPELLEECFGTGASYIFQPDKLHAELDTGDRTFQCGRRPDALKLWLAWKSMGDAALEQRIDHAVDLADRARALIADSDGEFHAVVPGTFTNVCCTWVPPELRPLDITALNAADRERLHQLAPVTKRRLQAEGSAMIGYQPVDGVNCFRLIFMNPEVTTDDVDDLLGLLAHHGPHAWAELAAS